MLLRIFDYTTMITCFEIKNAAAAKCSQCRVPHQQMSTAFEASSCLFA